VEAFLISIAHAQPLIVGLNCALGPDEMEPFIEELARVAPFYVSAYPNAGLPDPLSETGFPETPKTLAPKLRKWAQNGWLNVVGGCCGTTPEHIRAIAEAVKDLAPRAVPQLARDAENPAPRRKIRTMRNIPNVAFPTSSAHGENTPSPFQLTSAVT
jgi:5-methyltetrahydrofolate--homocysteine methyltransferase